MVINSCSEFESSRWKTKNRRRRHRRLARESGFHKHIAKPVTAAMLLAAVATLLDDKDRAENGG